MPPTENPEGPAGPTEQVIPDAVKLQSSKKQEELTGKINAINELTSSNASGAGEGTLGWLLMDLLEELVDEAVFSVVIEEHRMVRLGLHRPTHVPFDPSSGGGKGLVNVAGYDVFGNQPVKNVASSFACPNCGAMRHPTKFAPHLEKCMGMGGRESKRVAASRSRQQADEWRETSCSTGPYKQDKRAKLYDDG